MISLKFPFDLDFLQLLYFVDDVLEMCGFPTYLTHLATSGGSGCQHIQLLTI